MRALNGTALRSGENRALVDSTVMDSATLERFMYDLEASQGRVVTCIQRVPPDAWDDVIHTGDGAWTRGQLLSHMAANDLRQLVRIRIGAGIPEPGDDLEHAAELEVHDWNRARVAEREGSDVETLVAEMQRNRAALIALLRSLTPGQRGRMMPFRGEPTPLAEMLPVLMGHLESHARELAEAPVAQ